MKILVERDGIGSLSKSELTNHFPNRVLKFREKILKKEPFSVRDMSAKGVVIQYNPEIENINLNNYKLLKDIYNEIIAGPKTNGISEYVDNLLSNADLKSDPRDILNRWPIQGFLDILKFFNISDNTLLGSIERVDLNKNQSKRAVQKSLEQVLKKLIRVFGASGNVWVEILNGDIGTVSKGLQTLSNRPELLSDTGTLIPLSQFLKTKEDFGGGGGVAGGSRQTETVEAGQCIVNAYFQKENRKKPLEDLLNLSNVNGLSYSLGKNLTADVVLNRLKNLFASDPGWKDTLNNIGEKLVLDNNLRGVWHWQDNFVHSINSFYLKSTDILPGNIDRWNPADIWFTDKNYGSIEEVLGIDKNTVLEKGEFTEKMNALCENKVVVGISLKKQEKENIEMEFRSPSKSKLIIKPGSIKINKLSDSNVTLSIEYLSKLGEDAEGFVGNKVIIRPGNEGRYTLRCNTLLLRKSTHFNGGCNQALILFSLKNAGFSEKDVDACNPENKIILEESRTLINNYILDHQNQFEDEEVLIAEKELGGIYPVYEIHYPESDMLSVSESGETTLSVSRLACRNAILNLEKILNIDLAENGGKKTYSFIQELVEWCYSIHIGAADHYKLG